MMAPTMAPVRPASDMRKYFINLVKFLFSG
jgi:hypothetical protein